MPEFHCVVTQDGFLAFCYEGDLLDLRTAPITVICLRTENMFTTLDRTRITQCELTVGSGLSHF